MECLTDGPKGYAFEEDKLHREQQLRVRATDHASDEQAGRCYSAEAHGRHHLYRPDPISFMGLRTTTSKSGGIGVVQK